MEQIKVTYNDLINQLNDMYRKHGLNASFMKYVDRLLERGEDCYNILNALDYMIPEEYLLQFDISVAVRHANNLKYINKEKFEQLIIDSQDAHNMLYVATNMTDASIDKLESIIAESNPMVAFYLLRDVEKANVRKVVNILIKKGSWLELTLIAENIKGADIKKIQRAIISSGYAGFIYKFAKTVKGADIQQLEDAVIATGVASYMYYFAQNVKGADKEKLREAIARLGETRYARSINIEKESKQDIVKTEENNISEID